MSKPGDGVQVVMKPTVTEMNRHLGALRKDLAAQKTAYTKASIFLDRWVQKNFKSEGGSVGGWPPLQAGGRHKKGKGLDTSAKVLQDTGRGRASYKPFATRTDAGIGSDVPYMKKHEEGDGVPKRRTLPVKKEVWPTILKIFNKHVEDALKKVKLR